jgi:Uma2 family endonuclease
LPATTGLMTVDEFRQLPETGHFYYELRHGELVKVTRPKFKHCLIQGKLQDLLRPHAGNEYWVSLEIPFRAVPEYDLRVADVAALSLTRRDQTDPDDFLQGAPELVIEVVSPSNTVQETADKERLCLENGCREFWVVNPMLRHVKVSTPDGITHTYESGHEIPLNLFGGAPLPVSAIFE